MEFTSHEVTENSNQTDCLLPDQTGYFRSFQPAVDVNHDTRVHTAQIVIRHRLDQWGRTTRNKCSSPEYRSVAGPRLTINRVPRVITSERGEKIPLARDTSSLQSHSPRFVRYRRGKERRHDYQTYRATTR